MAHLHRLILCALLALFFGLSHAGTVETIPATSTTQASRSGWQGTASGQSRFFETPKAACDWAIFTSYGWPSSSVTAVYVNADRYDCHVTSPPAPFSGSWGNVTRVSSCVAYGDLTTAACPVTLSCPSGYWGPTGGTCSRELCADGVYRQPGTCPAVNLCSELSGQLAGRYEISGSTSGAKQVCETALSSGDSSAPGCLLTGTPSSCVQFGSTGEFHCEVPMYATGASCAPSLTGSLDVPPTGTSPAPGTGPDAGTTTCPVGTYQGTVNGSLVCVKPDANDTIASNKTQSVTTTNPDGSTSTSDTTTTTTCNPSGCTTSTTTQVSTVPAGGGSGTTQTTTQDGTCSRGSPGCGDEESSSFGGSCGAAFTCGGDAIFCAVALEQHKRNCALFVDASPESQLYDTEKGKTGPQYTSENVNVGPGNFSQANALGGASQCISDKVVTVWNHQVTLPFSQVCGTLQHLGTVLLFVSFLIAYRIVTRG